MGMAKLKFEHKVRTDYIIWDKVRICWVYLDLSKRFFKPKVLILGTWGCLMGYACMLLCEPLWATGELSFAVAAALGLCNGANIAATCHQPPKHVSHSKSTRARREREKSASQSSIYFFCRPARSLSSQPFLLPYFCVDVCACPFPARSFHLRPLLLSA